MGGQPSKTSSGSSSSGAAQEKAAVERARSAAEEAHMEADDYHSEKGGRRVEAREAQGLPLDVVAARPESILQDPKNRLAMTVLTSSNPQQVLGRPAARVADQQIFNVKVPLEGAPITNQRSSGRCWLFASTNIFRVALMKKYNLDSFELSQAYLFYWDKLEKANWFLEQALDTAGEDLDGRLVQTLLGDPISDGGQWDMVYNLVDKYGLVPQSLYPDSWNARSSGTLNAVLKNKLREYALRLRRMAREAGAGAGAAALSDAKNGMVAEVQQVLTLLLGAPPSPTEAFVWQYRDGAGRAHEVRMRPREFARDIGSPELRISAAAIEGMVSLVDDRRHEPLSLLAVSRLGNVVGGRAVRYVNVEMAAMKAACVKMLRAGLPVFFGCDVGKFSDREAGILDTGLVDYRLGLGTDLLAMGKAQRLRTGESQMTHAMVLTAVHVDERTGEPVRWRVQNSWGTGSGSDGWYVMTDAWMDAFVFQAVVDPRFCSGEVRRVLDKEPVVLPLWDPMGSLA